MRLSLLIFLLSCHHVLQLVLGDDITLTRHSNGDVFTIPGSCNEACMVLSSDTASPFGAPPSISQFTFNDTCSCQCNFDLPVFREDLRICVDNIQECDVAGFESSSGLVEKVPYVFLPHHGQIIYPDAEIKFEGVESPVCVITGVQQLGRSGWSELRNISTVEFPLSFCRDEDRTFLRWTGDTKLRETAEGKIVIVKLTCRDSYPTLTYRRVFTPCIAFRVAGTSSRNSIKEVSFSTNLSNPQGLTSAEYTAIGVSSMLLALIYVASISLYLHSRKSRRKTAEEKEPEVGHLAYSSDIEGPGVIKCNPLLSISRHFESDTNSAVSESDLADKFLHSENESEVEKITSALIHPRKDYIESQEQNCNSGAIIGERLPEEDVRIIETTENGNQPNIPLFPGLQRRKLYFNPAYFEKQLLLAPPPAAIEFLFKIREVISIAKHKMTAKRYVPTLQGKSSEPLKFLEIPEESSSERLSFKTVKPNHKRAISVQDSRKILRCSGCPSCSHRSSTPNLSTTRTISGENRVRAWLEDVKLLDSRWRNLEEERRHQCHHQLSRSPRFKDMRDLDTESTRLSIKSLPPLFREVSHSISKHGCLNQVFDIEQYDQGLKKLSSSVIYEPGYFDRQTDQITQWAKRNNREYKENAMNVNVRQNIKNSFKKQMEHLQHNEKQFANKNEINLKNSKNNQDLLQFKNNIKIIKKSKAIEKTRVLLNIINDELSGKNHNETKRIMDAVIQELIVAKEKEKDEATKTSDYETDSLEKAKIDKKISSVPILMNKYSSFVLTTLPMDEELKTESTVINLKMNEEKTIKNKTVIKNHDLPEVVSLRPENYALVSEVYVNDGYTSPAESDDDSGPEIQYEPENPGHLTIKVLDSPNNYIKQDESEYEPDTLDRKPMKLKINDEITHDKDIVNEIFVDSLERSSQIVLQSKRSFKEKKATETLTKSPREYNSLREIYEARIKYQQKYQHEAQPTPGNITDRPVDRFHKNCRCTSPLLPRQERRQRKANNQPDVVPKPPPQPPPPELATTFELAKNAQDRSATGAGDPTNCKSAPVVKEPAPVVGKPPVMRKKSNTTGGCNERPTTCRTTIAAKSHNERESNKNQNLWSTCFETFNALESLNVENERKDEKYHQYRRFSEWQSKPEQVRSRSADKSRSSSPSCLESWQRSRSSEHPARRTNSVPPTLEDSAYVSSPDSNGSRRRLLLMHGSGNSCNYTESDESTSGNGANSESGAESIETDSVFFGNFRDRLEREKLTARNFRINPDTKTLDRRDLPQRSTDYHLFQIKSEVC